MKRIFKRLYFRIVPTYRILETVFVRYETANELLQRTANESETRKWVLAKEEDNNHELGWCYLCRKLRIRE